jgi:hypothetical protein
MMVGVGCRLASIKLTLLPRTSTTSRTTDSEYLCWAEFFFHGVDTAETECHKPHVQEWSILDSSGNYSPGVVYTIPPLTLVVKAPFLDSLSAQTPSPPKFRRAVATGDVFLVSPS